MDCPVCNGNLTIIILHGSEVGICPLCQGIWFDSDGLKNVVDEMIAAGEVNTPEAAAYLEPRKVERTSQQEGFRMCPQCGLVMKKRNYATDSNVFIDRCGQCGGIWTDTDELMAIAEYIKGDPRTAKLGDAIIKSDNETKRAKRIQEWVGTLIEFFLWWV